MRWKLACGSLALAVLLLAQSAHAITQLFALTRSCFTITAGTTCDFAPMESGPGASSSIDRLYGGNFLTHAGLVVPDWDSFGANVRASADYADPFGAFALSATGRTTARYRDTLTVSGGTGSGSLRFTWHVEGSNTIEWAASPDITTSPRTSPSTSFASAARVSASRRTTRGPRAASSTRRSSSTSPSCSASRPRPSRRSTSPRTSATRRGTPAPAPASPP
jgi:hypothetical protein